MLTIFTFIAVLGFLIFIHELGHFLAARQVGVRVETFSIGFPPMIWGKKIGDTEYKISWIPLGGYVRLFGQNVTDEDPGHTQNYAGKSILQRLYILVAGPLMNLLFALVCMPAIYLIGIDSPAYIHEPPLVRAVTHGGAADALGVMPGDLVRSINGVETPDWQAVHKQLGEASAWPNLNMEVERNSLSVKLEGRTTLLKAEREMGWKPHIAAVVGGFTDTSPARDAGISNGDRIVSINSQPVRDWSDIFTMVQTTQNAVSGNAGLPGKKVLIEYERVRDTGFVEFAPYFDTEIKAWLLGMSPPTIHQFYGLGDSVYKGTLRLWQLTRATFWFLGQMLSGKGSLDDLGGPIRIGMVLGDAARSGVSNLVFLMTFISLQLGIFNLLPIPALDGGHILLLAMEKLKGGPLNSIFRERAQMLGFSVLIALMLFVTWNDLMQLFKS